MQTISSAKQDGRSVASKAVEQDPAHKRGDPTLRISENCHWQLHSSSVVTTSCGGGPSGTFGLGAT